ncbi:hypothetical protein ACOSQ2_021718 [Xanthoceras sorbifolium]
MVTNVLNKGKGLVSTFMAAVNQDPSPENISRSHTILATSLNSGNMVRIDQNLVILEMNQPKLTEESKPINTNTSKIKEKILNKEEVVSPSANLSPKNPTLVILSDYDVAPI